MMVEDSASAHRENNNYTFLKRGGEMGELIRTLDWSKTAIGAPDKWPKSLSIILGVILRSKFPMFLWWGKDMIQFYNDAYRLSLGDNGKHPAALGQKGAECWPEIWDIIYPLIQQVQTTGEGTWREDQLVPIFRNGIIEDVYWTYSYSEVLDDDGNPGGILVTCVETTEKVKDHQQLEESADQLAFAIEATGLATWDFNPATNKLKGNNRFREWFGATSDDDFDLTDAMNAIAEKDRQKVRDAINRSLTYESGGLYDIEYTIVNATTFEERIVKAKGKTWFNADDIAYRFNGTLQDVTQEATALKKALDSEAKLASVIAAAPAGIGLFVGRDLIVEMPNQTFIDIVGKGADIVGKPLREVMPELLTEDQPFLKILDEVFTSGKMYQSFGSQVDIVQQGIMTHKFYNITYTPLLDLEGKVYAILDIALDVTEQVLARHQIEKVVAQRTKELADVNEQLQQQNTELNQFAYIASHDLQEPLRKVRTFTSLMETSLGNIPERAKGYMDRIQSATERMQALINDVLAFSKLSKEKEQFGNVDLKRVVQDALTDYELLIDQKNAKITFDDLPVIEAIHLQMNQLFTNIISNALKFTDNGRQLEISIRSTQLSTEEKEYKDLDSENVYYKIEFIDNGIGFDKVHASQIFTIFQRLHGKTDYEGTGIGLAMCKKIVQNHHGIIYATSVINEGSTFTVILPQLQNKIN